MKVVVQRVTHAEVEVAGQKTGYIGNGLMVLAGFVSTDTPDNLSWMAQKLVGLRIFNDDDGVMNRSILDVQGDILLVSQFTLHASTKKGNRPSYLKAAKPEVAIILYQQFHQIMEITLGKSIPTGIFGADMKVSLLNDGPVTIVIDTENKE
jgi:D-tyrosyl-tRNA(Tyr) deacylase